VHNAASRWSKALLDNAARPSGAIVYRGMEAGGAMSQDQFERLQSELETHHQGARNAGRPMLLEGGLDWKPMGFSPSDMEFQKTKEAAARDIALAFGVPPMLLGIPGDATYANYAEAHRAFFRLTVLPLAQKVLAAMSHWVSGLGGEAVSLSPDLDQVPALAAEREAQWRRISEADFLSEWKSAAFWACPSGPMAHERTGVGGSRYLYAPFDAANARIDANERVLEERWTALTFRLEGIEKALERLERRLWLAVFRRGGRDPDGSDQPPARHQRRPLGD
jgi:hypothetical protein